VAPTIPVQRLRRALLSGNSSERGYCELPAVAESSRYRRFPSMRRGVWTFALGHQCVTRCCTIKSRPVQP
jgi:hypothetical protein